MHQRLVKPINQGTSRAYLARVSERVFFVCWFVFRPDQFFLTVYTGNNQVRLRIEKCNSTHARNHRKLRQAHIKKMVWNEDAFTQRFQHQTGSGLFFFFFFFFGFEKKAGPDPFHENIVWKVYKEKISGPYQLFYGYGPIFFLSCQWGYSHLLNLGY